MEEGAGLSQKRDNILDRGKVVRTPAGTVGALPKVLYVTSSSIVCIISVVIAHC